MSELNPYEPPTSETERPKPKEQPESSESMQVGRPGRLALVSLAGGILGAILGRLIAGRPFTALPLLYSVWGVIVAAAADAILFRRSES